MIVLGVGRSGKGQSAVAPTVNSASCPDTGGNLTIVFSQPVTGFVDSDPCGFTLTPSLASATMGYVSGDGTAEVLFGLSRTIYEGESLSLTYSPGVIVAVSGGLPLAEIVEAVGAANNSTQEGPEFPVVLELTEGGGYLTIPIGTTLMEIECYGAGGGGGGGGWATFSETYEAGGGGGGGGLGSKSVPNPNMSTDYYSWNVGTGGTGGGAGYEPDTGGGSGGTGGTTQIQYGGVELLCNGEGGGGGNGNYDAGPGTGGLGGVNNNGDFTTPGGDGGSPSGGGGGGGYGNGGDGGNNSPSAGSNGQNGFLRITYSHS